MSDAWLRFWNRPNAIYAKDRHRDVHCSRIADDLLAVLPSRTGLRVLDYGCGEARDAARVAGRIGHLYLYDAAPSVRLDLAARLDGVPSVEVLDDAGLARLPCRSIDVIAVCSVLQYVHKPSVPALLDRFRELLDEQGLLVLADVIPPECGLLDDVGSLLSTAARHGFLLAAIGSLGATLVSDYRRVRRTAGLSTFGEAEIRELLGRLGFACERHSSNFGFNPARRTYLARRTDRLGVR